MNPLLKTDSSWAPFVTRLTLAAVIFPHGAQKLLGWFGGHGLGATLQGFEKGLGVPAALAVLVIAAEFLGPLGLASGLLTRVAAGGLIAVMTGTIAMVHLKHGFFMNWTGQQGGEGIEFALLTIGASLAMVVAGAGRYSLDGLLARRLSLPSRSTHEAVDGLAAPSTASL